MTFLAPLFLLGAAAIVGPILLHLIRRSTKEKTAFSSLMFLQPTPPRVTRRSRLENLWLLLLRCLVIVLLALGFGRPFFQKVSDAPPAAAARKRTVVLVDTSASMKRGDLWKHALERVEHYARLATPTDDVALVAFARDVQPLMTFDEWQKTSIEQRVPTFLQKAQTERPEWGATNFGAALLHAAELLDAGREVSNASEIVVISDLQEGMKLDGLQGFGWPKGIRVTLDPLESNQIDNASVQWLSESHSANEAESDLRVRVQSAAMARNERYQLQWAPAPPVPALDVYVPAGQSRVTKVSAPPANAQKLVLAGDAVDFDNSLYIVPPEPARLGVLFLGNDVAADTQGALYYLGRSFPDSRQQVVELIPRPPDPAPSAYDLQRAHLLVLGEGLTDATISVARQFAESGRMVLYPVSSAAVGPALARMLNAPTVAIEETRASSHALLGSIDFTHPLFSAFADPRFSDFTKIRFWKHRVLQNLPENAKVLARFDDRSPALVQAPIGKGSVLLLSTTWRPVDGQLALSSKFVPLLQAILELSSGMTARPTQYFVGDTVTLPSGPTAYRVQSPEGKSTEVQLGGTFSDTGRPGVYTVSPGDWRFVVNLAPEESRLTPIEPGRLAALGVPLQRTDRFDAKDIAQNPAAVQAAELESQQKVWRWLLLGALLVLLIETLIAAKISQPSRQPVSP